MPIAQDIINKSLRMLGAISSGDSATAAELSDGLVSLNSIVDSWAADPRFYFCEQDEGFATTAKQNYCIGNANLTISTLTGAGTTATAITLGKHSLNSGDKAWISGANEASFNIVATITVTGPTSFTYTTTSFTGTATGSPTVTAGDFYTDRPIRLLGAYTTASGVDSPLALITEQFWANVQDKTMTGTLATKILYRPNYPFGQIILYPVPTTTPVLHLKSEKAIGQFSSLTAVKLLPPGYQRMLELALAIEISPEYQARIEPSITDSIKMAYASIVESNARQLPNSNLSAGGGNVVRT